MEPVLDTVIVTLVLYTIETMLAKCGDFIDVPATCYRLHAVLVDGLNGTTSTNKFLQYRYLTNILRYFDMSIGNQARIAF